jgi:hypothetical protein
MRAGGGKAKGAEFERDVCRKLSLWVSNGRHDDVFWRSAMSGGRATLAQKVGKRRSAQDGDISAIRNEGHSLCELFNIECKFYKNLNLLGMFSELKTRGVNEFWTVLNRKCGLHKLPMLIAKQNRMEEIVVLSQRGALLLGLTGQEFAIFPSHDAYFFTFMDFLMNAELTLRPKLKLKNREKK